MSNEENQISNLIEAGLAYEQEITLQITALQERATAASLECIKHLNKDNGNIKDYLKALAEHTAIVKQINKLKKMLGGAQKA